MFAHMLIHRPSHDFTNHTSNSSNPHRKMHIHETHVLIYTIILIASLLVLLMMLWHISTAHLIDNYNMPQEWYAEFINEQFPGWRIGLWVLLFFMVRILKARSGMRLDIRRRRDEMAESECADNTQLHPRASLPRLLRRSYIPSRSKPSNFQRWACDIDSSPDRRCH
jgi:hypothetical protein